MTIVQQNDENKKTISDPPALIYSLKGFNSEYTETIGAAYNIWRLYLKSEETIQTTNPRWLNELSGDVIRLMADILFLIPKVFIC